MNSSTTRVVQAPVTFHSSRRPTRLQPTLAKKPTLYFMQKSTRQKNGNVKRKDSVHEL
jgi:hypothetical protein